LDILKVRLFSFFCATQGIFFIDSEFYSLSYKVIFFLYFQKPGKEISRYRWE